MEVERINEKGGKMEQKKQSVVSATTSPMKNEHGLTKQSKLFFANVSNHLNK